MKIHKTLLALGTVCFSSSCDFIGAYDYIKGEHEWTYSDAKTIFDNAKESYNTMIESIQSLQTSIALYIATNQDNESIEEK